MDSVRNMWDWSAPMDESVFLGETHDEEGNVLPRR
jgi:hypothetical protein